MTSFAVITLDLGPDQHQFESSFKPASFTKDFTAFPREFDIDSVSTLGTRTNGNAGVIILSRSQPGRKF